MLLRWTRHKTDNDFVQQINFLRKIVLSKADKRWRSWETIRTNEFKSLALFNKILIALDEDSLDFLSNISWRDNSKK